MQVWPLLIAGQTALEIAQLWPDRTDVGKEITAFADQLVEAGLINSRGDVSVDTIPTPDSIPEYAAPTIENYTDMQDLLMLDPIHEVDVAGWPKKPETNTKAGS